MKTTVHTIITTIMITLLLVSTASAGFLSAVRSSGWETKETKKYKINVMNYDCRVYEWIPADNPNVRCVFVAGNENATGVSCYQVSKEKQK